MRQMNVLEIDANNSVITDLGFSQAEMMKNADACENLQLAEELNKGSIQYYEMLHEKKRQIVVHFSGFRRNTKGGQLFVLFDGVELIYQVSMLGMDKDLDPPILLEKEYQLYVDRVDTENGRVYLADFRQRSRSQAYALIKQKLEAGEDVFLRGNIIGLQRNGGKRTEAEMAAYVNVEGLDISGVIPIKQWGAGYSAAESFKEMITGNIDAIVNFRVTGFTKIPFGKGTRTVLKCSRRAYLTKIGYNPWDIVTKTLKPRSVVKVKIVETGKSSGSYFGALDGIFDFNMLCYVSNRSDLKDSEVEVGRYYYGYVQRLDYDKKFMRVRLTGKAEIGGDVREAVGKAPASK